MDSNVDFAWSPEMRVYIVFLEETNRVRFSEMSDPQIQVVSDWGSLCSDPLLRNPTVKWG